jgi:hypothetical protein
MFVRSRYGRFSCFCMSCYTPRFDPGMNLCMFEVETFVFFLFNHRRDGEVARMWICGDLKASNMIPSLQTTTVKAKR